MKLLKRNYSGTRDEKVSQRELVNRKLSRKAAGEGAVLLKNNGLLPIETGKKIAVYGNGIAHIIKGGTGSGDVNERLVVSALEGLKQAGFCVVNEKAARDYMEDYKAARLEWRERVLARLDQMEKTSDMAFFNVLEEVKQRDSKGIPIIPEEIAKADAVVFILSRIAGEGSDRKAVKGDYYLTDTERQQLDELAKYSDRIVLVINTGGQVDLQGIADMEQVASIVYLSQPGMEAGNVLADLLSGSVNFSGKLTTTWSVRYDDFPNATTYSHCNGDVETERYEEGIYVGYRYFDSFGVKPLYPFGHGLSYTRFSMIAGNPNVSGNLVSVPVIVTNIGEKFSGKQVVQLYASCPQQEEAKELKRLVGFGKTKNLATGESETLTITADVKNFASYDYNMSAWVIGKGIYGLFIGEDSQNVQLVGALDVSDTCVLEKVAHILPLQEELSECEPNDTVIKEFTTKWHHEMKTRGIVPTKYEPKAEKLVHRLPDELQKKSEEIAAQMTDEELTAMLMGEITKGQDNIRENELVETGIYVPGAAGETSCRFEEKYGIPALSMADGPAGIRVMRSYDVDNSTGKIYGHGLISALEGGFLAKDYHRENVTTYHMYATAIPIGTMLAQTWNSDLLQEVGQMVAGEMVEFGISWWLAPGMNIHRNPLCGRNFEYFSEDPLVAGTMAAAITNGVQSVIGVGTTIKHFACNNQEDNRMHSNSIVSERALREIYLRGFEIAIKTSQPKCIMSSYNLINGVPTSNSTDLLTVVARGEWDFQGIIMTDWTTTTAGSATPHKCPEAGNDLIMPGNAIDVEDIKNALSTGELSRDKARACVARMIRATFQSLRMG